MCYYAAICLIVNVGENWVEMSDDIFNFVHFSQQKMIPFEVKVTFSVFSFSLHWEQSHLTSDFPSILVFSLNYVNFHHILSVGFVHI